MDCTVLMTAVKTALKEKYGVPRGPGLEVEKGFLEDVAFSLELSCESVYARWGVGGGERK